MSDDHISREVCKFLRYRCSNEFTSVGRFLDELGASGTLVDKDRLTWILQTQKRQDGSSRFESNTEGCYRATRSSSAAPTPAGFTLKSTREQKTRARPRDERIARKIVWCLRHLSQTACENSGFAKLNDVISNTRGFGSRTDIMNAIASAKPHRDGRPRFEMIDCEDGTQWIRATSLVRENHRNSSKTRSRRICPKGNSVIGSSCFESQEAVCVGSHALVHESFVAIADGYLRCCEGQLLLVDYVGVEGDEEGWGYGSIIDELEGARGWFPLKRVRKLPDIALEDMEAVAAASFRHREIKDSDIIGELNSKLKELDNRVAGQIPRVVKRAPEDRLLVQQVGCLVEQWVQLQAWGSSTWPFAGGGKIDRVPNIMDRVTLFCGAGVEARIHIFKDANETRIHNHRTPFYSYCLFGDYEHCLWKASPNIKEHHYEFNRTHDSSLQQSPTRFEGRLEVELAHQHQRGLTFFLSAHGVHTVKHDGPAPVVTLYIKGLDSVADSLVFHEDEIPCWGNKNEAEIILDGSDRICVLDDLFHLLNGFDF